jgi:hypothetical protein
MVSELGKWLLIVGLGLSLIGGLMLLGDKVGLFRLPGDFTFKGKNTTVYVPIATSILVSIVLTVLLNLFMSRR